MSDEITLPGMGRTDITDATDSSLITDFTQVVSSVVGINWAERRRQKIRDEIVRQCFDSEPSEIPLSKSPIKKLFNFD